MTPDLKVRAKYRRAYLLKSIRAMLKFILDAFKSFASTVASLSFYDHYYYFYLLGNAGGILKRNKNFKSF